MVKKTEEILKKKRELLNNFLDQASKVSEIIPTVLDAKEQTDLAIKAISNAPQAVSTVFNEPQIRNVATADLQVWEKALPNLTFNFQYITTSGSGASGTASEIIFDEVDNFTKPTQPIYVQSWAKASQVEFIEQREKKERINEISEKLIKIYSKRNDELVEADNLYHQAYIKAQPPKVAAIAMRNTLEHFKGDLLNLARTSPGEPIKKGEQWNTIFDRLASNGVGSPEHTLFKTKENDYKNISVALTNIAKNLSTNPLDDLKLTYQKWINFFFTTLNLIDSKYF